MKMILKIAKKEVQQLFFSPIAWLLLICFIVQTGLIFITRYTSMAYATLNAGGFRDMAYNIFADQHASGFLRGGGALWLVVKNYLYLYIPLLTMGIVCREVANGSIKLMYSSPVRNSQIILGKFVALMGYGAIMMAPLVIYVVYSWLTIDIFDIQWALTGVLGLFLLACTYMAIGIFVSSLTTHQGMAAIGTFLLLGVLSQLGNLWQQYDFFREFAYWFSMNRRCSSFIDGIVCTEDVIYFVGVCSAFLLFTIIRMNADRQKTAKTLVMMRYLMIVVGMFILAWLSTRPALMRYVDVTSYQRNTLNQESQKILKQIDGELTITTYINVLSSGYNGFDYPSFILKNRENFERYIRFKPDITLKTVYYYSDKGPNLNYGFRNKYPDLDEKALALKFCEENGLNPRILKAAEELEGKADLAKEEYGTFWEFETETGKRSWYRGGAQISPYDEARVMMAFKRLIEPPHRVGIISGHGERSMYKREPLEYKKAFAQRGETWSLINQGFDAEEITLDRPLNVADWDYVLLADPREVLPEGHVEVLEKYLAEGGNLVVLGEPYRREILNPLLEKWFGLELTPLVVHPVLQQENKKQPANQLVCPYELGNAKALQMIRTSKIRMTNAAGIIEKHPTDYTCHVLARTDAEGDSWTELETDDFEDGVVVYNPDAGEVKGQFATMVGLTRTLQGREQKIAVLGDADFMNNENYTIGFYSLYDLSRWMSDGAFPLYITRPLAETAKVLVNADRFVDWAWVFPYGVSGMVLILGIVLWVCRRGR